MPPLNEKINKPLPDFRSSKYLIHHSLLFILTRKFTAFSPRPTSENCST
jgi:hypothetical protein